MLLDDDLECRVFKGLNGSPGLSRSELTGEFGGREPIWIATQLPNPRAGPVGLAISEHLTYG
jgi:hypothetical protein